ncbi:hypothetical protein BT67DRAFT_190299 [Trichocladium antarcticum]|uniref:Uncharacterized protein n=1 Tax=Trichocladium antarcticum TaxID=1450529 RepID=A0AAN6ZFT0_9PEZI|nr:hypothetical protein BT67DRAFT_190299 [Trichocladium antarcticum]
MSKQGLGSSTRGATTARRDQPNQAAESATAGRDALTAFGSTSDDGVRQGPGCFFSSWNMGPKYYYGPAHVRQTDGLGRPTTRTRHLVSRAATVDSSSSSVRARPYYCSTVVEPTDFGVASPRNPFFVVGDPAACPGSSAVVGLAPTWTDRGGSADRHHLRVSLGSCVCTVRAPPPAAWVYTTHETAETSLGSRVESRTRCGPPRRIGSTRAGSHEYSVHWLPSLFRHSTGRC